MLVHISHFNSLNFHDYRMPTNGTYGSNLTLLQFNKINITMSCVSKEVRHARMFSLMRKFI